MSSATMERICLVYRLCELEKRNSSINKTKVSCIILNIHILEPFKERREVFMEDDGGLALLSLLREWIVEQVNICGDVGLLDLIYKMLLNG